MSGPASPDDLDRWQRRALELARACELDRVAETLQSPRPMAAGDRLRVVVVGDDMRGKSTLVNGLAAAAVVPVGPTTRPVLVVAGDRDELQLARADGTVDARPLEPASWASLAADGSPGYLRASVRSETLAALDVELVDTPGLDLGDPARSFREVPDGDVALLVVAATSPLSMSERSFVEHCFTKGRAPHPTVVVTKLDLVDPDERAGVVDYVTRRVHAVSAGLAVISVLPGPDGLNGVIRFIVDCRGDPARLRRRARQQAWRLHDSVATLREAVHERAAHKGSAVPVTAERAIAENAPAWTEIVVEMRNRRGEAARRSRERLERRGQDIATRLCAEARSAPDPRAWWQHELPSRLDHELRETAKLEEIELARGFQEHIGWLDGEIERRFQVRLTPPPLPESDVSLVSRLRKLDLADLEMQRTALRIATHAAAIVIAMVLMAWEEYSKAEAGSWRQQANAVTALVDRLGD